MTYYEGSDCISPNKVVSFQSVFNILNVTETLIIFSRTSTSIHLYQKHANCSSYEVDKLYEIKYVSFLCVTSSNWVCMPELSSVPELQHILSSEVENKTYVFGRGVFHLIHS